MRGHPVEPSSWLALIIFAPGPRAFGQRRGRRVGLFPFLRPGERRWLLSVPLLPELVAPPLPLKPFLTTLPPWDPPPLTATALSTVHTIFHLSNMCPQLNCKTHKEPCALFS